MSLTAREWLLLPKEEQEHKKGELSKEECAKLRMDLDMIHFTEDEKKNMAPEKREAFLHPKQYTKEEREAFNKQCEAIFKRLLEEAEQK